MPLAPLARAGGRGAGAGALARARAAGARREVRGRGLAASAGKGQGPAGDAPRAPGGSWRVVAGGKKGRRTARLVRVQARGADGPLPVAPGTVKELPIFPLGLVPLMYDDVPLRIFEARYRVLFNTLLHGAAGLEDDLAQLDSPFLGSRKFGLCFTNQQGEVANTGGLLTIVNHEMQPDGQMLVESKVIQRFKVVEVIEQRPVLLCKVEYLDEADGDAGNEALADEVRDVFKSVVRLVCSLNGEEGEPDLPTEVDTLEPSRLSYWIPHWFPRDPIQQQLFFELDSTKERLAKEKEVFENTYQYHLARSALKNVFADGEEEGSGDA